MRVKLSRLLLCAVLSNPSHWPAAAVWRWLQSHMQAAGLSRLWWSCQISTGTVSTLRPHTVLMLRQCSSIRPTCFSAQLQNHLREAESFLKLSASSHLRLYKHQAPRIHKTIARLLQQLKTQQQQQIKPCWCAKEKQLFPPQTAKTPCP